MRKSFCWRLRRKRINSLTLVSAPLILLNTVSCFNRLDQPEHLFFLLLD